MKFEIVVCLMLVHVAAGVWNCNQFNNPGCVDGTCNHDGSCTCDDVLMVSYDCHVSLFYAASPEVCDDPLCTANAQFCYTDPLTPGIQTCTCFNGFYGTGCEFQTEAVVECDATTMYINIRVEDWFDGEFTPFSGSTDPACNLEDIDNFVSGPLSAAGLEGFGAEISLSGCGTAVTADTPDAGDTTYTYDVFVDYSKDFNFGDGANERLLRFTCVHSEASGSTFELADIDDLIDLGLIPDPVDTGAYDVTSAELFKEGRVTFTGGLPLFEKMEYVITLDPGSSSVTIGIDSCTFYNSAGQDPRTYIVNQCTDSPLGFSVIVDPSWEKISATEVQVNFRSFQYTGHTTLEIDCNVNFCDAIDDPLCQYCPAIAKRSVREKRDSHPHNKTVRMQFTVLTPSQHKLYYANNPQQELLTNNESTDAACESNIGFLATTITLGALLLVAVIVCVAMAMKLLSGSHSSTKTAYDNPVYPMKA